MKSEVEGLVDSILKAVLERANPAAARVALQMMKRVGFGGIFNWDLDRQEMLWSRETYRILGMDYREELTPQSWRDLVIPEDIPRCEQAIGDTIERGWPLVGRARRRFTASDNPWAMVLGLPTTNDDSRVVQICGRVFEAVDSKAPCVMPLSSNRGAEFMRVARASRFPVVLMDVGPRVKWVSPAFTAMCEYGLDELKGQMLPKFLHGPRTSQSTRRQMRESVDRMEPFEGDILNYTKSRKPYRVQIHFAPAAVWGDAYYFVAVESEVTAASPLGMHTPAICELLYQLIGILGVSCP